MGRKTRRSAEAVITLCQRTLSGLLSTDAAAAEKPVIVISSAGAAVTMIDGRSVDVIQNVLILTDGGEFGRPGKGFTVTQTAHRDGLTRNFLGEGIVVAVDSGKAMVRGNQVLFTLAFTLAADGTSEGIGILTVATPPSASKGIR